MAPLYPRRFASKHREARPAILEAPRRIGGLVFDEDASTAAWLRRRTHERREVPGLLHRRPADPIVQLDPRDLVDVVAHRLHQSVVVPRQPTPAELLVLEPDRATQDLGAPAENRLVERARHQLSLPNRSRASPPAGSLEDGRRRSKAVFVARVALDELALDDPACGRPDGGPLPQVSFLHEPAVDPRFERNGRPCLVGDRRSAPTAKARHDGSAPNDPGAVAQPRWPSRALLSSWKILLQLD